MVYTNSIPNSVSILVRSMNQLTIDEKHSLKQNCENAIRIIEPDFDEQDFDHNKVNWDHPIWGLIGSTPGILMLGELGESLQNLRNMENFSIIVERLKNPREFNGAYNELQIGNNLFKYGISFKINSQLQTKKSPDFVIDFEGREINLEITEKEKSQEWRRAERNAGRIKDYLFKGFASGKYVYSLSIQRPLSDKRTEKIFEQCQLMEENVQNSGLEEYHIPDVIDLYIYKPECIDKVPGESRRIFCTMPRIDEVARIKAKINKKSSQLDNTRPGILLILDNYSWLFNLGQKVDVNLKMKVGEFICDFENISALILQNNYFIANNHQEEFIIEEKNCIFRQAYNPKTLFTTNKLILLNEYTKNPIQKNEIELLKRI